MRRIEKLLSTMEEENLPALYISNPKNVRYLCGFTGEDSALLLTQKEVFFLTDGRYVEQAAEELPGLLQRVCWRKSLMDEAAEIINKLDFPRVGFEGSHLSYSGGEQFKSLVKTETCAVEGWVEKFRGVKDEEELRCTLEAVRIADKTFMHILNYIRPGVSELDVATEMEYFMKRNGSEKTAFPTIVASGIRSSYPHGEASHKEIERGDMVILDFGATYKGYVSDITRTLAVGQPDSRLDDSYYLVLEAQQAGLRAIRSGMTSKELDAIIRAPFIREGMNAHFTHGAGHSIGLDIHEAPYISSRSEHQFAEHTIMTIEPGLYYQGIGGVRIEDDVLVKSEDSCTLSKSPKSDLLVLPFY